MGAKTQIFLSYARLDEKKVEKLYKKLSDAGFKPWMDKKDILPGEVWKFSIQKAIRRSDFFLACLSKNSVTKRGFLQKEIKDALDIWQEMLGNDIYLIPVQLEDCELPENLREFQWVNLLEADGWTRLTKAIQVGMKRREDVIGSTVQKSALSKSCPVNGETSATETTASESPEPGHYATYVGDVTGPLHAGQGDIIIYPPAEAQPARTDQTNLETESVGKKQKRSKSSIQEDINSAELRRGLMSNVRFVNREYELRRICTLNGTRFILVDAPPGYGKSHLLFEARKQMSDLSGKPEEKSQGDYPRIRCVLVEFGDRLTSERQVLDAICQQMNIPLKLVISADDLASELINAARRSEEPNKLDMVMLLFDNIDQIRIEGVKTWLVCDLIAGLDKGLGAVQDGIKLRAVLAGRFVAREWDALGKQEGLKFTLLPLSPFSRDFVGEALRLKAKEVQQNIEPLACSAMVRGIVRVTGGHPHCMSQVIDRLAAKNFSVKYEGSGNYFDRINKKVLKDDVQPVIDELMEKLNDQVSDLLWRISIFRCFNQRILDILLNSGEIEGFGSGEKALASLNATALITPPGIVGAEQRYEHLHTDRIVRRLLALAMKAENPKLYYRLNSIARHTFKAWLDGKNIEVVPMKGTPRYAGELPNKPKDHLQISLVQEYFYHYLQSVETLNEGDLEQEAKRLHDELDSSLGAFDIPNQYDRLRDALKADWELEDRVYYLAGKEDTGEILWQRFLEWACGPTS